MKWPWVKRSKYEELKGMYETTLGVNSENVINARKLWDEKNNAKTECNKLTRDLNKCKKRLEDLNVEIVKEKVELFKHVVQYAPQLIDGKSYFGLDDVMELIDMIEEKIEDGEY